jgi:hypothetical protein
MPLSCSAKYYWDPSRGRKGSATLKAYQSPLIKAGFGRDCGMSVTVRRAIFHGR